MRAAFVADLDRIRAGLELRDGPAVGVAQVDRRVRANGSDQRLGGRLLLLLLLCSLGVQGGGKNRDEPGENGEQKQASTVHRSMTPS